MRNTGDDYVIEMEDAPYEPGFSGGEFPYCERIVRLGKLDEQ